MLSSEAGGRDHSTPVRTLKLHVPCQLKPRPDASLVLSQDNEG